MNKTRTLASWSPPSGGETGTDNEEMMESTGTAHGILRYSPDLPWQ